MNIGTKGRDDFRQPAWLDDLRSAKDMSVSGCIESTPKCSLQHVVLLNGRPTYQSFCILTSLLPGKHSHSSNPGLQIPVFKGIFNTAGSMMGKLENLVDRMQ